MENVQNNTVTEEKEIFPTGQNGKKRTSRSVKERNDKLFVYIVLFLPLVQFCIFYIGVNFNSILMTFQRYDGSKYVWNGLGNFKLVWTNFVQMKVFGTVVKNSLLSFLIVQLMSPVILFFSFFIYKKFFGYQFFKIVLFLPTIISTVITVTVYKQFCEVAIPYIWKTVFNHPISGLLSNVDTRFGAVMFFYMWLSFGTLMLMYIGAMNGISDSLIEACHLDGANSIQEFVYVVFPMIYPTFATLFYTSVATIFTNQINLYSIWSTSADSSVWTFGYYLYKEIVQAPQGNYPYLTTIGVLMTLIAAPLTFIVKGALNKIGPSLE